MEVEARRHSWRAIDLTEWDQPPVEGWERRGLKAYYPAHVAKRKPKASQ